MLSSYGFVMKPLLVAKSEHLRFSNSLGGGGAGGGGGGEALQGPEYIIQSLECCPCSPLYNFVKGEMRNLVVNISFLLLDPDSSW